MILNPWNNNVSVACGESRRVSYTLQGMAGGDFSASGLTRAKPPKR